MGDFKKIALLVLVFGGGIFTGRMFFPQMNTNTVEAEKILPLDSNEKESNEITDQKYQELLKSLSGINPEQVKEYLRTQNAEDKLKKADEILGKIMQLLVAQVGFRLSNEDMGQFGKLPSHPVDSQPPPKPLSQDSDTSASPNRKDRDQQIVERNLKARKNAVSSEGQALKFGSLLGNNYGERIQDSGSLTPEQVQELNGRFEGQIIFDKDRSVNRLSFEFSGRIKNKFVDGKFRAVLSNERGQQISNSSGNGDLSSDFSGNQNEVFIEIGKRYLQMTYFPQIDVWAGSLLEGNRGNYTRVGSLILRRQ